MAHFRGTIQGQRGSASRLGSVKSGIVANVNAWDVGIRVESRVINGEDAFAVYLTAGSNGSTSAHPTGTFTRRDLDLLNGKKAS